MPSDSTIESIENRWDVLYRDYPEVYDRFASFPYSPTWLENLSNHFSFEGKRVLDIGSGSGKSTFELAQFARTVTGIEPESAMLQLARTKLHQQGYGNVEFFEGSAQQLPVPDHSFDILTAVTTVFHEDTVPAFIAEAERAITAGGVIICVNIAPGWYGGELHEVIGDRARDLFIIDEQLRQYGFDYLDLDSVQDYGSIENIVSTYGFIFGRSSIDYLRKHNKTTVLWRNRVRFKRIAVL